MATITSVTNFNGVKSWADTTAWQGGVVPTSSDLAQIRGIRTTINMSAFGYWTGTKTITVASTSGFPATGSFYTVTERSEKIKIDYTGISGNTFTGCTIDSSYFPYTSSAFPDKYGGNIPNSSYVHYTPIIEITGSVDAGTIIVEQGGYLKLHSGGSLNFQQYITVRDGTLHASGSASFEFGYNNTVSNAGEISRIQSENYILSQIIFEGTENRLNTALTQDAAIGDGYITVNSTSGFEIDDFIIVKDPNLDVIRRDDGFRNIDPVLSGSQDECLNVVGISGSRLYVSRMNSIDVPILEVLDSSTLVIDSTRLEVGEKVVIGTDVYEIQTVSDYDYLLKDYDFTLAGTDLSDWETDTTRSAYHGNWQKSSSTVSGSAYALIQHGTTSYRHLFVKDIMRQEVKVEAWVSNYRNVTSGTSDRGAIGVVIHADPIMDYDRGYDAFARTYFEVDADNNRYRILQRAMSNDNNHRLTTAGISYDGLKKLTVECRGGMIRGYIDDELVGESFMRSGGFFGRVGLHSNNNNSLTCTRFKVYATAQVVTLNKTGNFTAGQKVYETGIEFTHKVGNLVVKQASVLEDPLGHKNLAYGYRGAAIFEGNSKFPYIYNHRASNSDALTYNSRTTNSNYYNMLNNQSVYDYNFNHGSNISGSMIIDLTAEETFTHVSHMDYYYTRGQYLSTGVTIQTSNDLTNWTTCYSVGSDTRRRGNGDVVRIFELDSAQTARYVRFVRHGGGSTNSNNNWYGLGVRNLSDGNKIKVNNVSDFSVGDKIIITYFGGYAPHTEETGYYTTLLNNTVPSGSWLGSLRDDFEITAVDAQNKTLTLDRQYDQGPLSGGELVYKVNRSIKLFGSRGNQTWKTGRFNIRSGQQRGRYSILRNVELTTLSNQYPTNRQSDYEYSSFSFRNYNNYKATIRDNVSIYNCQTTYSSYGPIWYSSGHDIVRDCIFAGINGRWWMSYFTSNTMNLSYWAGNLWFRLNNENFGTWSSQNCDHYFNFNKVISCLRARNGTNYHFYSNASATVRPQFIQKRRNYMNGGQDYGDYLYTFDLSNVVYDVSDNMFEYMDDNIFYNLGHQTFKRKRPILPKKGNTDNRLTRYRNEGVINADRYTAPHQFNNHIENYNNWGYNIAYNDYNYWIKYPRESFYRCYKVNNAYQQALFGMTLVITGENTTADVSISFDYFHSKDQAYLSENTNNAALGFTVLRYLARYQSDVVLSKPTSFETANFNVTLTEGYYLIILTQAARNGYVAFKNVTSSITSTTPQNINIMTNSFDLRQVESPIRNYDQYVGTSRKGQNIRLSGARLK